MLLHNMVIDSHQHFWNYNPQRDTWIDEQMKVLKRDFKPADLHPLLQSNGIEGCITVQADQSEDETNFLLKYAQENTFIKGVVGWVDLQSDGCESRLSHFTQNPIFKGVRHILQSETPEFMRTKKFKRGIASLCFYDLTYDLLVYPHHLEAAIQLVKEFPQQRFILDHLAKPDIKNQSVKAWASSIKELAQAPNLACKISGMVTEADWNTWKTSDFTPYLDIVFEAFGSKRVLYGSDWPVCLLAASYEQVYTLAFSYGSKLTPEEQALFMGKNAVQWYCLTL